MKTTLKMRIIISFIAMLLMSAPVWAEESKVHFHGYGELHYNDPTGGGFPDETKNSSLDMHRFVWGLSYDFSDKWTLHTEIDFEHAATELELEFAYVEYKSNAPVGFRAGVILMPVGPLNEFHEPPLFYSVERPYVQKFIIPTTWNEAGFGIFGESSVGLKYRLYVVGGLNAGGFSSKGIRDGRQLFIGDAKRPKDKDTNVTVNNADKFGGVGRLEYTGVPGLAVGVSYYNAAANGVADVSVSLWDVDLRYKIAGFDIALLSAESTVKGADKLIAQTVGEKQSGQYGEIAYHLNHLIKGMPDIVPFYRVEQFNTHESVPTGVTVDKKLDQEVTTYGLAYYPNPDIAFKVDQEQWSDASGRDADRTNVGIAYMF
jgi:hypothetical protein